MSQLVLQIYRTENRGRYVRLITLDRSRWCAVETHEWYEIMGDPDMWRYAKRQRWEFNVTKGLIVQTSPDARQKKQYLDEVLVSRYNLWDDIPPVSVGNSRHRLSNPKTRSPARTHNQRPVATKVIWWPTYFAAPAPPPLWRKSWGASGSSATRQVRHPHHPQADDRCPADESRGQGLPRL